MDTRDDGAPGLSREGGVPRQRTPSAAESGIMPPGASDDHLARWHIAATITESLAVLDSPVYRVDEGPIGGCR